MQSGRQVPPFWRNVLPPSSEWKFVIIEDCNLSKSGTKSIKVNITLKKITAQNMYKPSHRI